MNDDKRLTTAMVALYKAITLLDYAKASDLREIAVLLGEQHDALAVIAHRCNETLASERRGTTWGE